MTLEAVSFPSGFLCTAVSSVASVFLAVRLTGIAQSTEQHFVAYLMTCFVNDTCKQ